MGGSESQGLSKATGSRKLSAVRLGPGEAAAKADHGCDSLDVLWSLNRGASGSGGGSRRLRRFMRLLLGESGGTDDSRNLCTISFLI